MSVRKTLVRNTIFNAGGRLWEAVCNILLVAYIVPRVGLAGFANAALTGRARGDTMPPYRSCRRFSCVTGRRIGWRFPGRIGA